MGVEPTIPSKLGNPNKSPSTTLTASSANGNIITQDSTKCVKSIKRKRKNRDNDHDFNP